MGYRNYSVANGLIVDPLGNGDFTTISSAITAAVSGQTVFVRPGTYTENPTLKAGVDLVAFITDSDVPNVIIHGTCSFSSAGTTAISGIQLLTNSNFALSVTGSVTSVVYINDCYINCVNSTGIQITSSSNSTAVVITDSTLNLTTTGITYFTLNFAGSITIDNCIANNTGGSTTTSTLTSGTLTLTNCTNWQAPITTSGTASININNSRINCGPINTTALTHNSTSTISGLTFSRFDGGTASAISIGSGAMLNIDCINVVSSNTNAITGSGTIKYGLIVYSGTSSTNNVTTQTPNYAQPLGLVFIKTLIASASTSLDFTSLPSFKVYIFVINNLTPATNAEALEMLISTNNGSSYNSTGYTGGVNYTPFNSATVTNFNASTFAPITSNSSNTAPISGTVYMNAGAKYYGTVSYTSTDASANVFGTCGGGVGANPNAFRFLMASGNITSGSISIYGLNN